MPFGFLVFFALFGVCFALDRPRAFGFLWCAFFLDLGVLLLGLLPLFDNRV